HRAMATSSGLMLFTAATGTLAYAVNGILRGSPVAGAVGFVHLGGLAFGGAGALLGARFGVRVQVRTPPERLRRIFAMLLVLVALQVLVAT
ncbi:MAG: TSUP family transporter, partial [Proteobacteria bacterium]|nr:TSUP family transporter [Pseudomonadota bacterium]